MHILFTETPFLVSERYTMQQMRKLWRAAVSYHSRLSMLVLLEKFAGLAPRIKGDGIRVRRYAA